MTDEMWVQCGFNVFFSILVALFANKNKLNGLKYFAWSVIISPLLTFLYLLYAVNKKRKIEEK